MVLYQPCATKETNVENLWRKLKETLLVLEEALSLLEGGNKEDRAIRWSAEKHKDKKGGSCIRSTSQSGRRRCAKPKNEA